MSDIEVTVEFSYKYAEKIINNFRWGKRRIGKEENASVRNW